MADINSLMRGVGSNPGLIIDAYDFKGIEGVPQYGDTYLNRNAIRGTGSGQHIFDTGWSDAGIFRDTMLLRAVFTASGVNTNVPTLLGKISRRFPGDTVPEFETNIYWVYDPYMSPYSGKSTEDVQLNSRSTSYLSFDPKYEYRIEITTYAIDTAAYVDLDYLYIQFHPRGVISSSHEQGNTIRYTGAVDGSGFALFETVPGEPIQMIESIPILSSVSTGSYGGSGNPTAYQSLTHMGIAEERETLSSGTRSFIYNKVYGSFDRITSVHISSMQNALYGLSHQDIQWGIDYIYPSSDNVGVLPTLRVIWQTMLRTTGAISYPTTDVYGIMTIIGECIPQDV